MSIKIKSTGGGSVDLVVDDTLTTDEVYKIPVNKNGAGIVQQAIVDFGTIVNAARYVLANPFFDGSNNEEISQKCWVRAEVFHNSKWAAAGTFMSTTNTQGILGHSMVEGIVVQTGDAGVVYDSQTGLGGHSSTSASASAPCRVIVFYMGGTI